VTATPTPAGWYPDPGGEGQLRWWDGTQWTVHTAQAASAPQPQANLADNAAVRWTLPVGRSGWAIAAGYAGLFALVVCPAPLALVLGIVGIWHVKRTGKLGMGRAVFGLVTGAIGTLLMVGLLLADLGSSGG
jgi:hypothetical protein